MFDTGEGESSKEPSFWTEHELNVPLIPPTLLAVFEQFEPNHLGTLPFPDPSSDYFFVPSMEYLARVVPDHCVLSFWGHGINSYSANFRLAYGKVAVLFQSGFGFYNPDDWESSRHRWNDTVEAIDAFLRDIVSEPAGQPRERDIFVGYSNFRLLPMNENFAHGPVLYKRGTGATWVPDFTYRSLGHFLRAHLPR